MDASEPGPSGETVVTRKDIFDMAQQFHEQYFSKKLDLVESDIVNKGDIPLDQRSTLLKQFSRLKSEMKSKWNAANRTVDVFLEKNQKWLQGTITIPKMNKGSPGRPEKPFVESSERSKRRKTEKLRKSDETQEVLYASQMILRESGNAAAATVVKEIIMAPTRGDEYLKVMKNRESEKLRRKLTPIQALSMFVEAQLTRKQYEVVRTSDPKLYPCYDILLSEKKKCYPDEESINISEISAEVTLQKLLDHTSTRLVLYLEEVMQAFSKGEKVEAELIYKWGCDGSQQSRYKQKFNDESESDANIFQSSLVPLRFICSRTRKILWNNPQPSSPRFCRPMRIRFIAESKDVTTEEISHFESQISALHNTKIQNEAVDVSIKHIMCFTMIDGKVCNAATETLSTMRCYICKLTQSKFNDFESIPREVEPEKLKFGMSILHARIRFFESLLHISYKIPVQKWQIRSQKDKAIVNTRKQQIQKKFREELGLIVDVPKPGFGNSNDGNTSRRFFANPEVSSTITGLDLCLIKRFATILELISSGYELNVQKFETYCHDTAKLYIEKYNWHPMSPTVHKILSHGSAIIKHALLPIGTLSEEAAEARNKHFRDYRQRYSRKFSRDQCMYDVFHRLLLTSDPYISSIRPKPQKNMKFFSEDARNIFAAVELDRSFEDENKENIQEEDK